MPRAPSRFGRWDRLSVSQRACRNGGDTNSPRRNGNFTHISDIFGVKVLTALHISYRLGVVCSRLGQKNVQTLAAFIRTAELESSILQS